MAGRSVSQDVTDNSTAPTHEMQLAWDVQWAVEKLREEIEMLKARWPDEPNLHLHIAYNWRVAGLLKVDSEGHPPSPEGSGRLDSND